MSFEQLRDILQAERELQQEYANLTPVSCPNDGTPLQSAPEGSGAELFCPHDGWQYPRDYVRPRV